MRRLFLAVACSLLATAGIAADFTGTVQDDAGRPLAGALVTVFNAAGDRKETVYTDAQGRYAIRAPFTGTLRVRARAHRFEDANRQLDVVANRIPPVDFRLAPFANAQALSDSLTASAHLTKVQWPDEATRTTFISQCNYCHQMGNALTRVPREKSLWEKTVERMEGYGAVLTFRDADAIAGGLHRAFDGTPVQAMQKYESSDALADAKILEWHVGDAMSFVHDADVGHDGLLYGTDEGHDIIWILDRQTGKIEQIPQPDIDLPQGGKFAAMQLPLGVFTGKHGPHSLAQGKDGRFWITNALSSTLMSFDPKTRTFKTYGFDEPVLYPHTVRIDGEGIVWFTAAVSNKVVRFDPKTEKVTVLQLPHNGFTRWLGDTITPVALEFFGKYWPKENLPVKLSPHRWSAGRGFVNLPYGIDINPKDGSVWYSKLFANKIGRIDPKTLAIVEYDTPLGGPRRPRFDRDGILWIPAFDDSALMRFDPATLTFENYKLPVLAPGEYETPYALNVHPATGEVWITSNMSDRVLRFNPKTKTFIAYPSPTRVTWLRDMVFTEDGQVCSSSSNLPAWGIEDQRGAFFCIDPEGGARDRAALANPALKKK
ncbi:MAG: carboxypeptidase regulatory-like domain-containing protein [Gammaproteobacteria bacterium]